MRHGDHQAERLSGQALAVSSPCVPMPAFDPRRHPLRSIPVPLNFRTEVHHRRPAAIAAPPSPLCQPCSKAPRQPGTTRPHNAPLAFEARHRLPGRFQAEPAISVKSQLVHGRVTAKPSCWERQVPARMRAKFLQAATGHVAGESRKVLPETDFLLAASRSRYTPIPCAAQQFPGFPLEADCHEETSIRALPFSQSGRVR